MVGHISVPALDSSNIPASLSKPIVTDLLKNEIKFKGVMVTDALDMKAITNNFSVNEAVKLAINSGNDLILMPDINIVLSGDISELNNLLEYLESEVNSGNISLDRINDALKRVLQAKMKLK